MKAAQLRELFLTFSLSIRAHYHRYFLQLIDAVENDTELANYLMQNQPPRHEDLREQGAKLDAAIEQAREIINS